MCLTIRGMLTEVVDLIAPYVSWFWDIVGMPTVIGITMMLICVLAAGTYYSKREASEHRR